MNADGIKKFFKSKTVRIVLICIIALALLLAVWKVFFGTEPASKTSGYEATEEERRIALLLEKIEGVGDATVMVSRADGGAVSAVVVFDGTDGIMIRLRIAEVVASALQISDTDVLVCAAS